MQRLDSLINVEYCLSTWGVDLVMEVDWIYSLLLSVSGDVCWIQFTDFPCIDHDVQTYFPGNQENAWEFGL